MNDKHPNANDSHLPPPNDATDTHIDANLRALAGIADLPEATAASVHLHSAADRAEQPSTHVRRFARPRWLAASSLMAACVAVGVVLWTQGSSSQVQAAEILQSLRESKILGLDVNINRLSAEGGTVDGAIKIRFREPLPVAHADDPQAWERAEFGALHAKLQLSSVHGAEAPLSAAIELGFTPESGWVYLKGEPASMDALAEQFPQARGFIIPAKTGLLLNVGPIDEQLFEQIGGNISINEDDLAADLPPGASVSLERTESGATAKAGMRFGMTGADGRPGRHDEAIERLSRGMLKGTAGHAEIEQIKALLAGENQQMTVKNLGGGRYELVAELKDEGEAQACGEMTIAYQQNLGVDYVEFRPLHGATGSVRVSMATEPIHPSDTSIERLGNTPGVLTMDLRLLRSMLGGFIQQPRMDDGEPGTDVGAPDDAKDESASPDEPSPD